MINKLGLIGWLCLLLVGCQENDIFTEVSDDISESLQNDVKEATQEVSEGISDGVHNFVDETLGESYFIDEKASTTSDTFTATIERVYDGDTAYIDCSEVPGNENKSIENLEKNLSNADCNGNNEYSLRVLNIDSPELKSNDLYGEEAAQFAKDTLLGREVEITLSAKDNPTDRYGRLLVYIRIDGTLYQELIIRQGLARVAYLIEPDTIYAEHLLNVQKKVKREEKGIWSVSDGYVTDSGFDMSIIK